MAKTKVLSETKVSPTRVKDPKRIAEAEKATKNALQLGKDATKMKPGTYKMAHSSNLTDRHAEMRLNTFRFVEHLQQWIEKNSQPRKWFHLSKWSVRREPTRWGKRGPMTRRDWVRFYNWAATNALPKSLYKPKTTKYDGKPKKKQPLRDPSEIAALAGYIQKLAMPRKPRKKYEYPDMPEYAYAPQLDPKHPPKPDKGRPFAPPAVPEVFQHIDLETDFWSQLRFPLRPSTRTYNPSDHILKLAEPRIVPPLKPHCHIPEKPVEYVAPRRRMTRRQWHEHLRRVEYLAKPVYRPVVDIYYE